MESQQSQKGVVNKDYILLSIFFLLAFIIFIININMNADPFYDDYVYIKHIKGFVNHGGLYELPQNILSKKVSNSLTDPILYYSFLIPFYSNSNDFFIIARYFNLLTNLILIFIVYWVGWKLFSREVGLVAAFFVTIHPIIIIRNAYLASENLLLIFSILSLYYFIIGFDKYVYWILAFCFAILATLSKFNGITIIVAFIPALVYLLIFNRKKIKSYTLPISIIFITVMLFILNYSKAMGIINSIVLGEFLRKEYFTDISEFIYKMEYYSSVSEYLANDPTGFFKKILWGITFELHRFTMGLFTSIEFYKNPGFIHISIGYIVFPFFIYLIFKEKDPKRRIFYLFYVLIVFLSTVPRAVSNHNAPRYTIMVMPVFFYLLAPYILNFLNFLKAKTAKLKTVIFAVILLSSIILVFLFHKQITNLSLFPKFSKDYQLALDWMKTNVNKGEVLAIERNSKLAFTWYLDSNIHEIGFTSTYQGKEFPVKELIKQFDKNSVDYIIIDLTAKSTYDRSQSKYFFKQYIEDNKRINLEKLNTTKLKQVFPPLDETRDIIILKNKKG